MTVIRTWQRTEKQFLFGLHYLNTSGVVCLRNPEGKEEPKIFMLHLGPWVVVWESRGWKIEKGKWVRDGA